MSEEDKLQKAINEAQWRKKQIEDERRLQEFEAKKKRDEEEKIIKQKDEAAHQARLKIIEEQNIQREEANKREAEREKQRQIEQAKENQRKQEAENKRIATAKTSPPKGKSTPPPQPQPSKTQSYGWLIGGILFFYMVIGKGGKNSVPIPVKQPASSTIPQPVTYPTGGYIPPDDTTTVTITENEPVQTVQTESSEDATIPPDIDFTPESTLHEKTIVSSIVPHLNLRQEPKILKHNIIIEIPTGEEVSIIEFVSEEKRISGRKGRWCKIAYNGLQGYVFEAYLTTTYQSQNRPPQY